MPKRKAYNRDILRHLFDDEEDVVSVVDDIFLVDSDYDTAGSYSSNCCDEAIVDMFSQVTAQQRKNLKPFNIPGFAQDPGSSWSLTVIGADIALPTLDAVFNFIATFCNRGGLSTEVGKRAYRLHLQGVFQTLFPTSSDAVKVLTLFIKSFTAKDTELYVSHWHVANLLQLCVVILRRMKVDRGTSAGFTTYQEKTFSKEDFSTSLRKLP